MVTDPGRVTAHQWWATGQTPPVQALCMVITGTRLTAAVYPQTYYLVHHYLRGNFCNLEARFIGMMGCFILAFRLICQCPGRVTHVRSPHSDQGKLWAHIMWLHLICQTCEQQLTSIAWLSSNVMVGCGPLGLPIISYCDSQWLYHGCTRAVMVSV